MQASSCGWPDSTIRLSATITISFLETPTMTMVPPNVLGFDGDANSATSNDARITVSNGRKEGMLEPEFLRLIRPVLLEFSHAIKDLRDRLLHRWQAELATIHLSCANSAAT